MYRSLKGHNFTALGCGNYDFLRVAGNFNGIKEISVYLNREVFFSCLSHFLCILV